MASIAEGMFALSMWPLSAAQLGKDFLATALGAQRVIAARLPTIASAMRSPLTADHAELRQMVTEKVGAVRASRRSLNAANDLLHQASRANERAVHRLSAGHPLWPADWLRLAEHNIAAAAALAALPSAALAPFHRGVMANDKRLQRSEGAAH